MNKYNARKTKVDGITFHSRKEANRYKELKLLERAGIIKDLGLQQKFELVPKQKDEKSLNYYADFVYFDNENKTMIIEDVKGKKTDLYIAKRKLVKYLYGDKYKFIET